MGNLDAMQAGAIARSNDAVWKCIATVIVNHLKALQAMVEVFSGVGFVEEAARIYNYFISMLNFYTRKLRAWMTYSNNHPIKCKDLCTVGLFMPQAESIRQVPKMEIPEHKRIA